MNPNSSQRKTIRTKVMKMCADLGIKPLPVLDDYELSIATSLIDTSVIKTTWESIGGLNDIVIDLQTSVILPFTIAHLTSSETKLLRAPKGVLFHGPPGCGKTMLARAMAKAANCRFLNLQVHSLVNMWYGETQKLSVAVFSLARKLQPAIIFIDEIDSFLSKRNSFDNEATRMMKTQFMAMWDGLMSSNDRIMVVGATNRPADLDDAILRRLPYKVYVPKPNAEQRFHIIKICLKSEPLHESMSIEEIKRVAEQTDGMSGSDLEEICREAATHRLRIACGFASKHHGDSFEHRLPTSQELMLRPEDFAESINKFRQGHLVVYTAAPLPSYEGVT